MPVDKLCASIPPFTVIAPNCELVPNPSTPMLLSAELIVVVALPLLIVRLVELPVTVLLLEPPTVTTPLVVVIERVVADAPNIRLPFRVTRPEPVVILPSFQVSGPFTVKAAFVDTVAAKL